jgi:hypothetical protein
MILPGIFLALFTEGALHKKNVVQTFRSAVSGRTKVLHYIRKECGVSLMKRSADLQVCCISRTKVLHYIKAGVACRRMTMAIIIANTTYNFP